MHALRNYWPQLARRSVWTLSTCRPMSCYKCPKYFVGTQLKYISLSTKKCLVENVIDFRKARKVGRRVC
jgi:hypothetical protein